MGSGFRVWSRVFDAGIKRWAYGFALMMCALALVAWIEALIRGPLCILVFKDIVAEGLFFLSILSGAIFLFPKYILMISAGLAILAMIPSLVATQRSKKKASPQTDFSFSHSLLSRWKQLSLSLMFKTLLAFVAFAASLGWWWLMAANLHLCAGLTALALAVFCVFTRTRNRAFTLPVLIFLAYLSMGVIHVVQFYCADRVEADQLYDQAAYDVLSLGAGRMVAASAHEEAAVYFDGKTWETIADTVRPTHFVNDELADKIFIPNNAKGRVAGLLPKLSIVQKTAPINIPLARCVSPHRAALDPLSRKVFVNCEMGTVHMVDADTHEEQFVWKMRAHLYGIDVDPRRARVYLTKNFFPGGLAVLDVENKTVVDNKWIGVWNFQIQVDQATGNLWIVRPVASEVLVLAASLRILARIKVGLQPRDLEIDLARNRVYVGGYLGGVVSVLDLKALAVERQFRIDDQAHKFHRLRGIGLDRDGAVLLCNNRGIWRVRTALEANLSKQ